MADTTPFGRRVGAGAQTGRDGDHSGPLDDEQPKQRGMWQAVGAHAASTAEPAAPAANATPQARAQADWTKTHGNANAILAAARANQSEPLYLGKLASLVQAKDAKVYAELTHAKTPDPAWTLAVQAASDVAYADRSLADPMSVNRTAALAQAINRDPNSAAYEAEIFRQLNAKQIHDVGAHDMQGGGSTDNSVDRQGFSHALASAQAGGGVSTAQLAKLTDGAWKDQPKQVTTTQANGAAPVQGALQASSADAQQAITTAQKNYATTVGKIASLDGTCASELQGISPALGASQISAYIDRFRATGGYPAAITARDQAAVTLQRVMAMYSPQLESLAAVRPGDASVAAILQNYTLLASTSTAAAKQAAQWVLTKCTVDPKTGAIAKVTDPTYASESAGLAKILQTVSDTVSRNVLAALSASAKSGATIKDRFASAWKTFEADYADPFEELKSVYNLKNVGAALQKYSLEKTFFDAKGAPTKALAAQVARLTEEVGEVDPMTSRIITGLKDLWGVMSTIVDGSVVSLDKVFQQANATYEKVQELASLVKVGNTGDKAAELAKIRGACGDVAKESSALAKLLPLVGLAASIEATAQDALKLVNDPKDPLRYTQVLGDLTSTVGGALEMMDPPLDALGFAINLAGQAISGASSFFISLFGLGGPDPIVQQKEQILESINPNGKTFDQTLAQKQTPDNLAAAQAAGLSQAQIDALVTASPKMFTTSGVMKFLVAAHTFLQRGVTLNDRANFKQVTYKLKAMTVDQFLLATASKLGTGIGGVLFMANGLPTRTFIDTLQPGPELATVRTWIGTKVLGDMIDATPGAFPLSDFQVTTKTTTT